MKTILENTAQIFRADWGPTMKASARVLALAVAIPAAIVWVVAQWLLFTYRNPLAGVLALVPVRRPDPIVSINESMAALNRYRQAETEAAEVMREILADVAASSPRSASPAPISLVLAPGPRRQRRGSKQPQSPA